MQNFMFLVRPLEFWKITNQSTHISFFLLCSKPERRRPLVVVSPPPQVLVADQQAPAARAAPRVTSKTPPPLHRLYLAPFAHTTPSPSRHITAAAAGKLVPPLELARG